ncbi:MAG: hypothetical protein IJT83_10155 [Victivallales bacterium]|nr:hypothetical protein [Victivallales bacterium]
MGQHRRVIRIIAVFMAIFTLFSFSAEDKNKARAEWMGGFVKMESADKAVAGNAVAALSLYKEALEVFESVRRKYPQWNPSLLNYRINYCQQQINELERKMAGQANNLSTDELLELVNRQKKQLQELESAKKELTARVDFLQESLLRAREEASKSSTLESTATNLAEAKANLEKTVATLEVRLKNAENNLAELKARSAGVEKVRKEAERNQKRVEEQSQEIKQLEADLKANKKEVERLKRELKLMTSNKDDVDVALKTASELAAARKEEITALRKNLKISEEKINLKEKSIAELNVEMEKLKKQLAARLAENEELKRLRKNDADMLDEYRKGKDLSDTIARDNSKLKEELLVLNGRTAKTVAELREKTDELEKLRKEMDRERTASLAKEERNVELMSEISRLKQRNQQAEAQALKLSAELQEAKLVQSQKNDDMKSIVAKARESEELTGKLNELEQKLKGQIEVSRQQEEQIARQNKSALEEKRKLEAASKELEEARAKLAAASQEADGLKEKVTKLEVEALRENTEHADRVKQLNAQIATLTTTSKNTSETLTLKLADANAQVKSLTADLEKARAALNARQETTVQKLQESQTEAQKLRHEVDTNQEKYNKTIQELSAKLQAQNQEIDRLVAKCASFELKISDNERRYKEQTSELGRKADTEVQKLQEQQAATRRAEEAFLKLKDELEKTQKKVEDTEADKKELQAKIKDMEEEVRLLKAKTEVAEGLSLSLKEAESKIKALEQEKVKLMDVSSNQGRVSDKAVKLMAEKENFYKKQMKEKDDLIDKLMSGSTNSEIWLTKIKQLNEKLEGEARRRMAVEAALVDMEDKLRAQEAKAKEAAGKGSVAALPAPVVAKGNEMELNVAREQQRRTVINGFLRQATESERQGKIEAARYNYQKALELDPDNIVALQRMGIIAATLGNDPEAVKYLKQAFKLDTDNLDTLLALGYAQARLGESDWAVSYLGRAVALNPDNAYASRTYGAALFNMGWTEAAATRLLEAHRLKPDDPEAPFNLAVLYATAKQPDYQEASKWYKIAIKNGAQHDPGLDKVLGE